MNILFVGPYRQSDGWGQAAKEYIRALRRTGHQITIRPIYLNAQMDQFETLDEFDDLENTRFDTYDVLIQNCLPHMFRKYGGVKNIGLSFFETSDIGSTPWPLSINLMDEMWVSSQWEQKTLVRSGVTTNIRVVRIPVDETKYQKSYPAFDLGTQHRHEFKFYFIGEYVGRKNLPALVFAFYREFRPSEPVRLVIKTHRFGEDPHVLMQRINNDIESMQESINLYPAQNMYKKEILILNFLTHDELLGLHTACDCFVMPSSGEAFCLPGFDALMFGKGPVFNINSSMNEYAGFGFGVKSYKVPAITRDRPIPFLYTGRDTWYQVDILDLQASMREAFTHLHNHPERTEEIMNTARKIVLPHHTYESVAKVIEESLR